MSRSFDEVEITYDNAELVPATAITAAQWARAEAFRAIGDLDLRGGDAELEAKVNAYAELIITGSVPRR